MVLDTALAELDMPLTMIQIKIKNVVHIRVPALNPNGIWVQNSLIVWRGGGIHNISSLLVKLQL